MVDDNRSSTLKLVAGVILGALTLILAAAAGVEALRAGEVEGGASGRGDSPVLTYAIVLVGLGIGTAFLARSLAELRRRLGE